MYHMSIRACPKTLLFRDWLEAHQLWIQIVRRVRARALALMPDHVHLLLDTEQDVAAVRRALRAYALWRNHHRKGSGEVWEHGTRPTLVRGRQHTERTKRYIHLNPCRKGLVKDPLSWPFSTHRDAVGLAIPGVCSRVRDPAAFHVWVSADPSVAAEGTSLPAVVGGPSVPFSLEAVRVAVSALTRSTAGALKSRGVPRALFLAAAAALSGAPTSEIADFASVNPSTVRRNRGRHDRRLDLVRRVVGDPRFYLLDEIDLRRNPTWRCYRHHH